MLELNLHRTEVIIANAVGGVVLLALSPWVLSSMSEMGAPQTPRDAVFFGLFLGLFFSIFLLLSMAYYGYRKR